MRALGLGMSVAVLAAACSNNSSDGLALILAQTADAGSSDAASNVDAGNAPIWTVEDGPLGATSSSEIDAIAVDSAGDLYATGYVTGTFDGQTESQGEVFVTKYDPTGARLWTVGYPYGGITGQSLAVDSAGNAYVGLPRLLLKYASDGTFQWMIAPEEGAQGVTVDGAGNVYFTGTTSAALPGQTLQGQQDYFIEKYDAQGKLVSTIEDGSPGAYADARGLAIDSAGDVFALGATQMAPLHDQTLTGKVDYFVSKFDPSGTRAWTFEAGIAGASFETLAIRLDAAGDAYLAIEEGLPTQQGMLTKIKSDGSGAAWTHDVVVSASEFASSPMALDPSGNVYVIGTSTASSTAAVTGYVVTEYDPNGNVVWTNTDDSAVAGSSGNCVAIDAANDIYVAGLTQSAIDGQSMRTNDDLFFSKIRR